VTTKVHELSPQEALKHFGVKGMKWGVKKAPSGGAIRTARRNVMNEASAIRSEKKNIRKTTKRGSKERAAGEKRIDKMKVAFLNNPDRATAARMTRGEKAATLLLGLTSPSNLAGAVGAVASTTVHRKIIESRQRRGVYNKK
jgi:hypothetical protein